MPPKGKNPTNVPVDILTGNMIKTLLGRKDQNEEKKEIIAILENVFNLKEDKSKLDIFFIGLRHLLQL